MYLSEKNAFKVDLIRQSLDIWLQAELIDHDGWLYILASLINAIPSFSNIAGTYGAYLKHWDQRALKPLFLLDTPPIDSELRHEAFNVNGAQLLRDIEGDVLYIDPPYNGRQYSSNYHLLETVARYDSPTLKGKTGTRADGLGTSEFCKRTYVAGAFKEVLSNSRFRSVIISYSSDGILGEDELLEIVWGFARPKSLVFEKIPYRPYKRVSSEKEHNVTEFVIGFRS